MVEPKQREMKMNFDKINKVMNRVLLFGVGAITGQLIMVFAIATSSPYCYDREAFLKHSAPVKDTLKARGCSNIVVMEPRCP